MSVTAKCAPASSFPCFIYSVVAVSRMSDHEGGPEDDEEETTPAAKRLKLDQTESQVWPGHVRFNTPKKATLALLKSTPSLLKPDTSNSHEFHVQAWFSWSERGTVNP